MSTSLNDFKDNFKGGGTRQNRFKIIGNFPSGGDNSNGGGSNNRISEFHVRSSLIPTLQTSTIEYDYFCRKLYYPGEKLYSTWSASILDDTGSGDLWKAFQRWHNYINNHVTNSTRYINGANYKVNWSIQHLDLNGEVQKTFFLNGLWPRTINEISFNSSRPNVLNTFNVVFVYDTVAISGVTNNVNN